MTAKTARRPLLATACLGVAALAAAGCGGSAYGTSSTPSDAAATPSAYGSGADRTPSSAAKPALVSKATGQVLTLDARDLAFDKQALRARPGNVTLKLVNMGQAPHEVVLLRSQADPAKLATQSDGRASEQGAVGKVARVTGGATGTHTFKLAKGRYVFFCNVPGHFAAGMRGVLVVA